MHRSIAFALVFLLAAIAAVLLLMHRPECPGPVTGPEALPWINDMRVACPASTDYDVSAKEHKPD
jgi:hypothetical protein